MHKSLNKRTVDAIDECIHAVKKFRADSGDDGASLQVVGLMFHQKLFPSGHPYSLNTMNKHYTTFRKEMGREFPELKDAEQFPKMPSELQDERKQQDIDAVNAHVQKPLVIDADLLITKAIAGLQEALRDSIYPEVKLCLSFLLCMRSNDMSPRFPRTNGVVPKLGVTHHLLDELPGCFVMLPSKQREGDEYVAFSNVTIVNPIHYPLIKEAITFLLNHTKAHNRCYGSVEAYLKRTPCGAESKGCEWSDRLTKEVVKRLGFKDAIIDWNGWEEDINESFARRFVACCIHKEIIKFDNNLNVGTIAADYCLGHVIGSSATRTYLRYSVRPTQVPGLILKKVRDDNPIAISEDTKITQGLYLEQTP